MSEKRDRANFIGVPQFFNLNHACLIVNEAFGIANTFLVGSSLLKRDYRDVDIRTILDDEEFKRLFPNGGTERDAFWSLTCASISMWLSQHSGLPVDYQIQSMTEANEKFKGERCAVGLFLTTTRPIEGRADNG